MSDDSEKVDEILEELDLAGASTDDDFSESSTDTEPQSKSKDRLEKLRDAGALTGEEYNILKDHEDESLESTTESTTFGQPLVTSEGADLDFSLIGVFEDIDTTYLALDKDIARLDDEQIPSNLTGGSGRTLLFWHIHNHSNVEMTFRHDSIEQIGDDGFSYNQDENELSSDNFKPGWQMYHYINISSDSRVKYVSCIESPVSVSEIKLTGHDWSDVHSIKVTEEMKFPKSELPANVDL